MKKLSIFLIISVLAHGLFLMIKVPLNTEPPRPTKVEIVRREPTPEPIPVPPPQPVQPPLPQPVETRPQPPDRVIPPTPETDAPVEMLPEPNLSGEMPNTQDNITPSTGNNVTPIVPKNYNPDNPPKPMTFDEMLAERSRALEAAGPDRRIDDIIRDYLSAQNNDAEETFGEMSVKYDSFFYKFSRSLYAEWKYPPISARNGETGIVQVKFSITRDGRIININIIRSSGYSGLDREVMRTLRSMAPVALPLSHEKETLDINGFFIYTMGGDYRLY